MREQLADSRRALARRESAFTADAALAATQIAHLTRLNKELAEAKRTAENEVLSMQREVAPLRAISTLKASALKTHNELTERILKALRVQVCAPDCTTDMLLLNTAFALLVAFLLSLTAVLVALASWER